MHYATEARIRVNHYSSCLYLAHTLRHSELQGRMRSLPPIGVKGRVYLERGQEQCVSIETEFHGYTLTSRGEARQSTSSI